MTRRDCQECGEYEADPGDVLCSRCKRQPVEQLVSPPVPDGHTSAHPATTRLNPFSDVVQAGGLDAPRVPTRPLRELLSGVRSHITRFVDLGSPHRAVAAALWVLHCYAIDAAPSAAYLRIRSAAEESGKTVLLEVLLQLLAEHGILATSVSPSVVYRLRDKVGPVALLLDEVDNTLRKRADDGARDLLAIVNAGYRRSAVVYRSAPKTFEPTAYKAFGPAAIAGIGTLEATTESRCIPIVLTRKARGSCERFISFLVEPEARAIAAELEAWATHDVVDGLRGRVPDYPEELRDRQVEVWWPLLAIADLAGEEWPAAAREAARHLHGDDESVMGYGVLLLDHIRSAFEEKDIDRLSSAELVRLLVENEEGPWGRWWGTETKHDGAPRAAATDIARHLKGFGVKPKVVKMPDGSSARGYLREWFEEAWSVYLPPRNQRNQRNPAASEVTSVTSVTSPHPNGERTPTDAEALAKLNALGLTRA